MKYFEVLLLILGVAVTARAQSSDCVVDSRNCTSRFSGYHHVLGRMTDMTSQLLDQSFDFLLLSATFDQHHRDRPGFEKLYRGIADRAWNDAIAVMQYQTKRGYNGDLSPNYRYAAAEWSGLSDTEKYPEHGSLKLAVNYEKNIAEGLHGIHRKVSVAALKSDKGEYDPDAAHFLDEQLIKQRSESVRKLTGYVHMLEGILNTDKATGDLGLNMFDKYLASAE